MNDARYVPRDFSTEPRGFGVVEHIHWRDDVRSWEVGMLGAAKLQHWYVFRIRQRMALRGMSGKWYADVTHGTYDRIMKVFRGYSIMRLEDIAEADAYLGQISEFDRANAVRLAEEAAAAAEQSTKAIAAAEQERARIRDKLRKELRKDNQWR